MLDFWMAYDGMVPKGRDCPLEKNLETACALHDYGFGTFLARWRLR